MSDDLRARLTAALNAAPASFVRDDPEDAAAHAEREHRRHDRHKYYGGCALCRGEAETLADAAIAELQPELARLAQYESAINWQTSCLACSRVLDASVAETERAERAETEREEALQAVAQAAEDMQEFQRDMEKTRARLDDSRRIMAGWDSIRAERDAALAALARVREFALAVRASGDIKSHPIAQDILRLLDQPVLVPLAGPAGAGGTGQDGAQ